ncbi:hypothetical protein BDR06DRAFT_960594 [Suillus hirtellus]|nr:hypothetical protein BDR06DRAFT_960594 [Suillus hirtellus]
MITALTNIRPVQRAIITKFLFTRIDPGAPPFFVFRELFDIPRLSQSIGIRLLQWYKVKDPESQVVDDLGYLGNRSTARRDPSLNLLKLGEITLNIPTDHFFYCEIQARYRLVHRERTYESPNITI